MRKLVALMAFAVSLLTFAGVATADPPECGIHCPFVR